MNLYEYTLTCKVKVKFKAPYEEDTGLLEEYAMDELGDAEILSIEDISYEKWWDEEYGTEMFHALNRRR